MFDISFGELMIIGIIALVVIGPQRLPGVARTLGHLIGRAQRYVNDVKRDIQKEIDLEELNKVKTQMESAARSVQATVQDVGSSLTAPVAEAQQALHDASRAIEASVRMEPQVQAQAGPNTESTAESATESATATQPDPADSDKRENPETDTPTADAPASEKIVQGQPT